MALTLPILDIEAFFNLGQNSASSDQPIPSGTTNQASIYSGLDDVDQITGVTIPISGVILASGSSKNVTAQDTAPHGIAIKGDGTRLWTTGSDNNSVYQYDFGTAWDSATITFDNSEIVATDPQGLYVSPSGDILFVLSDLTNELHAYTISGYDVTTSVADGTFSIATEDDSPRGLYIKSDGTSMYMVGDQNDSVYQYDFGTPFDIGTLTSIDGVSVTTQETSPTGIYFKDDGTKMFVTGADNLVHQYSLSPAWDSSSRIYDNVSLNVGASPTGIVFKPDGTEIFTIRIVN
jgi:DNA-binding beta-propeller fold protein YncE